MTMLKTHNEWKGAAALARDCSQLRAALELSTAQLRKSTDQLMRARVKIEELQAEVALLKARAS